MSKIADRLTTLIKRGRTVLEPAAATAVDGFREDREKQLLTALDDIDNALRTIENLTRKQGEDNAAKPEEPAPEPQQQSGGDRPEGAAGGAPVGTPVL